MPHTSFLRNHGKTSRTPRRPFEKERLDNEMKLIGEFGLKNKREVWRVGLAMARIRKAARILLTLDEKDPKRMFEEGAPSVRAAAAFFFRLPSSIKCPSAFSAFSASPLTSASPSSCSRLSRLGVLDETKMQLDYVLALKTAGLERRLQTQVSSSASPSRSTTRAS